MKSTNQLRSSWVRDACLNLPHQVKSGFKAFQIYHAVAGVSVWRWPLVLHWPDCSDLPSSLMQNFLRSSKSKKFHIKSSQILFA